MVPVKLKKKTQLYYSFVYSRIAYGIKVYGSCNSTLLTKIQVMQNKLLKILYNRERRYPTNILHHEVKVLLVKDIHELLLLKFINTVLNGKPVKRFEHYFRKRNQTHNYATRHADSIEKDRCKTRYGKRKVHYLCATKWNDLENSIKIFEYSAFKKKTLLNKKSIIIGHNIIRCTGRTCFPVIMNKKADSNLAAFIWGHTTFIKSICIKWLIVGIYYDVELILMMLFRRNCCILPDIP